MDKWGRKPGLYIVSVLTVFAAIIQSASQNVGKRLQALSMTLKVIF